MYLHPQQEEDIIERILRIPNKAVRNVTLTGFLYAIIGGIEDEIDLIIRNLPVTYAEVVRKGI